MSTLDSRFICVKYLFITLKYLVNLLMEVHINGVVEDLYLYIWLQ